MCLCLLLFALGRYPGRLWPYFGLSALSRQLHRQELMAELFALCFGGGFSLYLLLLFMAVCGMEVSVMFLCLH